MNNSTPSFSSSLTNKWSYDVFISFRGPDVRKRFIGNLYQKLCEIQEVKTFMDDRTIEAGEQIDETLIKAIQKSRIGLVVFSANYASSSYCLEELAMIIECSMDQKSMLFLPVFYEVNPSVLRHQLGSYKEALTKHEARLGNKEKTYVWRRALNKAAGVSGFSSDNYKYDSDLIGDIAQSITKKISKLREGDNNWLIYHIPVKTRLLYRKSPYDFVKDLIPSVRSLIPDKVVEEIKKSDDDDDSLWLFTQSLEYLVNKGSQDVDLHNALAKIMIYSNNNPEHFLTTNPYYDSRVIGNYCKKRHPTLAVVAYQKGQWDDELLNVTNKNSLFELQARYVVESMDGDLWKRVLKPENMFRRQLIDQVVYTVIPETTDPMQIITAVAAFFNMDVPYFFTMDPPHEMIELLENMNLPHKEIERLGKIAVQEKFYEEAFAIFKKFNLNVHAVNVLLHNLQDMDRAVEFASLVKEDEVWIQVIPSYKKSKGQWILKISIWLSERLLNHY